MQAHIVALGGDAVDILRRDPDEAVLIGHPEFLDIARWRAALPLALVPGVASAVQRPGEALTVHGLHQIVDRRHVKGCNREIVECGDEDHGRIQVGLGERSSHLDPVHSRHGDVEQHEIGLHRLGDPERRLAVRSRADERHSVDHHDSERISHDAPPAK